MDAGYNDLHLSYSNGFASGMNNIGHGTPEADPFMFPPAVAEELYKGLRSTMDIMVIYKLYVDIDGRKVNELYVTIAGVTSQKIVIGYTDYALDRYIQGLKNGIMHAAVERTRVYHKSLVPQRT